MTTDCDTITTGATYSSLSNSPSQEFHEAFSVIGRRDKSAGSTHRKDDGSDEVEVEVGEIEFPSGGSKSAPSQQRVITSPLSLLLKENCYGIVRIHPLNFTML